MMIREGQQAEWDKFVRINTDPYGGAVVDYAKRWVDAMEAKILAGEKLEDIAKQTSFDCADGISGFQFGCAVSTLALCWEHGEALRRWHNLDSQIGSEGEKANKSGGVLNPALLNMGAKP